MHAFSTRLVKKTGPTGKQGVRIRANWPTAARNDPPNANSGPKSRTGGPARGKMPAMHSALATLARCALLPAALFACQTGGTQQADADVGTDRSRIQAKTQGRTLEASLPMGADPAEGKILADIERTGWSVHQVEATDDQPGYAYTVGLYQTFQHPEVCLFGLPSEQSQVLLDLVGEEARAGTLHGANQTTDALAESIDFVFRDFPKTAYPKYLEYAQWLHGDREFSSSAIDLSRSFGKVPLGTRRVQRDPTPPTPGSRSAGKHLEPDQTPGIAANQGFVHAPGVCPGVQRLGAHA